LSYLQTNWLSLNDWFHHLTLLWINTVPNIYNVWILVCYAAVGLFFYLLYEEIRDMGVLARIQAGLAPVGMTRRPDSGLETGRMNTESQGSVGEPLRPG
jgi:hypothetical protein